MLCFSHSSSDDILYVPVNSTTNTVRLSCLVNVPVYGTPFLMKDRFIIKLSVIGVPPDIGRAQRSNDTDLGQK